eukprot:jgi/Astpho2/9476/Aster-01729
MQMFQRGDKDAQEQLMPNRYTSDLEAAGAPKPELQLTCWVPSKCSTWRFCIYSSGDVSLKLTETRAGRRRWSCLPSLLWNRLRSFQIPASDVLGATLESATSFRVWYCPFKSRQSAKAVRVLKHSWECACSSEADAQAAVSLLQRLSCHGGQPVSRRVLVIINPKSGRGQSQQCFRKEAALMLRAAGMDAEVLETQHAGHATELARKLDLSQRSALMMVGGDGTVHEVLQVGRQPRPVYCGSYTEQRSTPSAGGRGPGPDVCEVRQVQQQTELLCYGVVCCAEIDAVIRDPLGHGRGVVHAVLQGLLTRPDWQEACKVPLAMIPTGSGNALCANTGMWDVTTATFAVCKGKTEALDIVSVLQPPGRRYYSFLSITYGLIANLDVGTENLRWLGELRFTLGALREILHRRTYAAKVALLPASKHQRMTHSPASGGTISQQCPPGVPTPVLDALGDAWSADPACEQHRLPAGWLSMGENCCVQLFGACNLAWLDRTFQLAPSAGLNTGCLDLVYTGQTSRREGLRILLAAEKGKHMQLPVVSHQKVAAMIFEPASQDTWLVLDGEVIPADKIFAEVHRGLCTVIVA